MKLLTLREIAESLQVSERTIRRLVNRGDLAGFKVGDRGQVRVKSEDLEAYLEDSEYTPTVRRPRITMRLTNEEHRGARLLDCSRR